MLLVVSRERDLMLDPVIRLNEIHLRWSFCWTYRQHIIVHSFTSVYHISLYIKFQGCDLSCSPQLAAFIWTPRVQRVLVRKSDCMFLTAWNLNYFFVYVSDFDWKRLSEVITVAKLTDLPCTPSINVSNCTQSTCMRITTRNLYYGNPIETCDLSHDILVHHVAST